MPGSEKRLEHRSRAVIVDLVAESHGAENLFHRRFASPVTGVCRAIIIAEVAAAFTHVIAMAGRAEPTAGAGVSCSTVWREFSRTGPAARSA
jgi:hypothetical protein